MIDLAFLDAGPVDRRNTAGRRRSPRPRWRVLTAALTVVADAGVVAGPHAARPSEAAGAAGYQHSVALGVDGSVHAWGLDAYGQVGDGDGDAPRSTPSAVARRATSTSSTPPGRLI